MKIDNNLPDPWSQFLNKNNSEPNNVSVLDEDNTLFELLLLLCRVYKVENINV